MTIKFTEEQLNVEVVVAREFVKDVVSGDIELKDHPSGLQVSEILDVKAQLRDVKAIIVDGGVEINGVIQTNIVYNAEGMDEEATENTVEVFNQEAKIDFENFIDIPEAQTGMHILLNMRIADISYEVLETDVLEIAITLIKYCALSDIRDFKCITQINGLTKDEVVQEQLRLEEWVGDESIRSTVSEEIETAPEVEDLLTVVCEVVKTEYKTMENAVVCEGFMEISLLCRTKENDLMVVDERLEFEHTLDLYGAKPGMTTVGNYKVNDLSLQKLSEDKVRLVGQVECYVKVTKPHHLVVVTDILNDKIDTEKETVMVEEMVGRGRVKDSIVHRINIPATRPDIRRFLQCYARVKDLTTIVNDGGLVVEGSLEGTVFYLAEEDYCQGDVAVCLKDNFDFDNYIPIKDCQEGMDLYLEVEVKRTSCQILNDRTLEMTVVLEKMTTITSQMELECVTDFVEISPIVEDSSPPSYVIYVVQKGDTLYKICRRYRVDLNNLIEVNNLENSDRLEIGQKILIPKSLIGAMG